MNSLRLLVLQLLVAGIASSESSGQTIAPRLPSAPAVAAPSNVRNLFVNSNYENGTEGWELIAFYKKGTMAIDHEELHNGKPTLRIDNAEGDHSFVRQVLTGKPNTRYRVTGFIKTKNVLPVKPGDKSGAILMVGLAGDSTQPIQNSTAWTKVTLDFATKDKPEIRVGGSLGYYGSKMTGTAWFSELELTELGEAAAQAPNIAQRSAEPKASLAGGSAVDTNTDPAEGFLKSAPRSALQKLKDKASAEEGATELNKYLGNYTADKWVVVHTKAEIVELNNSGKGSARIRAESQPVIWDGGRMERISWLYFPAENAGGLEKIKAGSEIAVYGQVRKCQITVTEGGPRFYLDLWKAKIYTQMDEPKASLQTAGGGGGAGALVKTYRNSLVFVNGTNGAGSGFIASLAGSAFLVTNAHVAAGVRGAAFKTLDGAQVQGGAASVAVGHDIFSMQLPPGGKPFDVMQGVDENASIDEEIVVLGNAEGAGVVNLIKGKIVGIGPNLVEVDAPFVPGNSGSPIIHLKSGKVIGVATYLIIKRYDAATKEAIKEPIIRRFGYRLDSVKAWQAVNWQAFYAQAGEMEKIETLTDEFDNLICDLASHKGISTGVIANSVIRTRINAWNVERSHQLSPRDRAMVNQNFVAFLKTACQADVTAARPRLSYDYFQRALADQQRARNEIAEVFDRIIKDIQTDR